MLIKAYYKYVKSITGWHKKKSLDVSRIITDENCDLLIKKGCKNPMERVIIAHIHESSVRAGELLNEKNRDIDSRGILQS